MYFIKNKITLYNHRGERCRIKKQYNIYLIIIIIILYTIIYILTIIMKPNDSSGIKTQRNPVKTYIILILMVKPSEVYKLVRH